MAKAKDVGEVVVERIRDDLNLYRIYVRAGRHRLFACRGYTDAETFHGRPTKTANAIAKRLGCGVRVEEHDE